MHTHLGPGNEERDELIDRRRLWALVGALAAILGVIIWIASEAWWLGVPIAAAGAILLTRAAVEFKRNLMQAIFASRRARPVTIRGIVTSKNVEYYTPSGKNDIQWRRRRRDYRPEYRLGRGDLAVPDRIMHPFVIVQTTKGLAGLSSDETIWDARMYDETKVGDEVQVILRADDLVEEFHVLTTGVYPGGSSPSP